MGRLGTFFFGIVLGCMLTLGAQSYHVIRTSEGFKLLPKRHVTLSDTYLDVRGWGVGDWSQHPDVLWSLAQNKRDDILGRDQVLSAGLRDLGQWLPTR
jgi:hypothetical protein